MILDTNALSAWLDGDAEIRGPLENATRIVLSPIVLGEYRYGILQSRERLRYEEQLRLLELEFPPLMIGTVTAQLYADLRQQLRQAGRPIPWHDLWITAQAREHNFAILSRDCHCDEIPGLTRLSW